MSNTSVDINILGLTDDELETVNALLPDIRFITTRFLPHDDLVWLLASGVSIEDVELLRKSRFLLNRARDRIYYADFYLYQALSFRIYFLNRSTQPKDANHILSETFSMPFADYVVHSLHSAFELIFKGICRLLDLSKSAEKSLQKKGKSRIQLQALATYLSNESRFPALIPSLNAFINSSFVERLVEYRNSWVHDKPQTIESLFPNPPYELYAPSSPILGTKLLHGDHQNLKPDLTWDEFVEILCQSLMETATLLSVCFDEWEKGFQKLKE
jgi:hypothetical protein